MIVVYFAHRFYRRDWKHFYIKRSEIDLDTGCSVENLELFKAQKKLRNNSLLLSHSITKPTDFGVRWYSCICNL
nr:CNT_HP1_G0042510.mRNA.1.CDS.1 [Saccharomyces cerevisiae]